MEEILYLFRGCTAAEHPVGEEAIAEVMAKRTAPEAAGDRDEVARILAWARERFEHGNVEPAIPPRPNLRRSFQGVVERAKMRRREIGAFLRGLDLGHTETSHMDAHGEASLVDLMKLAAGLENLAEARGAGPDGRQRAAPRLRAARGGHRDPDHRRRADAPAPPGPAAGLRRRPAGDGGGEAA